MHRAIWVSLSCEFNVRARRAIHNLRDFYLLKSKMHFMSSTQHLQPVRYLISNLISRRGSVVVCDMNEMCVWRVMHEFVRLTGFQFPPHICTWMECEWARDGEAGNYFNLRLFLAFTITCFLPSSLSAHIRNINNNYFEISELLITVIFMQCRVERLAFVGEAKESHGRAQHFKNEFNSYAIVAVFTICSGREVENMESFWWYSQSGDCSSLRIRMPREIFENDEVWNETDCWTHRLDWSIMLILV